MPSRSTKDEGVQNQSFVGSIAGSIGGIRPSTTVEEEASYPTIAKEALIRGTPLGIAAVAQFSVNSVLVAMVGKMVGVVELGATSLAFGLINATAYSFAAGFSGALETVLSHSYGRDPSSKLYGVYAQRMALLLLLVSACLGPVLAFADLFLDAIGQNPEVTYFTGVFCRAALFAVYPMMMLELLRRYFACQHLSNPLSVNLIISACVFPFLLWVMITLFGYLGAPIGWLILMISMPASLLVYLIKTKKYKKTWGGWDSAALHNWGPLMKLALPSMAMMLSEWASLEVNAITAGFAAPEHLAAYSVMYLTSGLFWSLTSGLFIEAAVLVGNALGKGKWRLARRCAGVCVVMSAIQAVINLVVLYFLRRVFASAFSDDDRVVELYVNLFPFFCLYHVFDCIQSAMMGVLRGCGKQVLGSVAIALVYSVVGVPLGIALFFTTDLVERALWLGPGVGVSCVGFPLYMWLFFRYIKWDQIIVAEADIPSLNSSMDRRSLRSHEPSTPSASDAEGSEASSLGTRHSATHATTPRTPGSALLDHSDALSGHELVPPYFHIPGRNILLTPSMQHATSPPSSVRGHNRRSALPSMGTSPELGPSTDGFALPPPSRAGRGADTPASRSGSGGSTGHRPPSSTTSSGDGRDDSRHGSDSDSSASSGGPSPRLRRPPTLPSTPPGEHEVET